jgi:hypothetical protein
MVAEIQGGAAMMLEAIVILTGLICAACIVCVGLHYVEKQLLYNGDALSRIEEEIGLLRMAYQDGSDFRSQHALEVPHERGSNRTEAD